MPTPRPLALLAELTHACRLHCAYCSNPLELVRRARELDTAQWVRVLEQAADMGVLQVHFSGGEPLLRRDLEVLVEAAVGAGLYPYLVTSGLPCSSDRLQALWDAGLRAVQVSLQDATRARNDELAGAVSFEAKRAAVEAAVALGFHVTLNVVLERRNVEHVAALADLAAQWNVDKLELAHAQLLGWARLNHDTLKPSDADVERARTAVEDARTKHADALEIVHVLPEGTQPRPRACLQGWGRRFLTVAPDGMVLPCHAARVIEGLDFVNVRDRPLAWIWTESDAFQRFRGTGWMREPCRSCEHRERDLGGCRCQAFLATGDAAETDPACELSRFNTAFRAHVDEPGAATPRARTFRTGRSTSA